MGRMADRIVASAYAQADIDPAEVGEVFQTIRRAAKLVDRLLDLAEKYLPEETDDSNRTTERTS